MDSQYGQHLRYKLQRRFRRLNGARPEIYHSLILQFWDFVRGQPALAGIVDHLLAARPDATDTAMRICEKGEELLGESELETAAIGAAVILWCTESKEPLIEVNVAHHFCNESHYTDNQRAFTELFVEPLYEHLDEQLDDRGAMLALLRSYKHKVEWFNREELFEKWEGNTSRGEKVLALHLYEYLHDQGVRFFIEPSSVSGEADLVSSQEGAEPLIADAKVFNPDRGKAASYLAEGFKQLYTYCVDYNESFGYLVIYKTSGHEIKLALRDDQHQTPFIVLNGKTIFFIVVDLFPHSTPASKRGSMKAYELTESDLVSIIPAHDT